jgi:hypothetical protein
MTHETSGDGLIPAVSQDGRSEEYWTERNALVDSVNARQPIELIERHRVYIAVAERTAFEQGVWDDFAAALDALKAFDAAHGGTPVL